MQRLLVGVLLAVSCAPQAFAQNPGPEQFPKLEIFGGYLAAGEPQYNNFRFGNVNIQNDFGTKRGLDTAVIGNLNRFFGVKFDFSAHFHHDEAPVTFLPACAQPPCSPVVQTVELNPRLFNFLIGPEIKMRNKTKFTPFAHALFGVAHTTTTLRSSGPAVTFSQTTAETGLGMAFGGGVDVRTSSRFSLRTSVDYNPKFVGRNDFGARKRLDDLRFSFGVLFH
jgi:opacity protein-like surface antigen